MNVPGVARQLEFVLETLLTHNEARFYDWIGNDVPSPLLD